MSGTKCEVCGEEIGRYASKFFHPLKEGFYCSEECLRRAAFVAHDQLKEELVKADQKVMDGVLAGKAKGEKVETLPGTGEKLDTYVPKAKGV